MELFKYMICLDLSKDHYLSRIRRNEIYTTVYNLFHEKKKKNLLMKRNNKTFRCTFFISFILQYFINFIPPTLLATVETKCSG